MVGTSSNIIYTIHQFAYDAGGDLYLLTVKLWIYVTALTYHIRISVGEMIQRLGDDVGLTEVAPANVVPQIQQLFQGFMKQVFHILSGQNPPPVVSHANADWHFYNQIDHYSAGQKWQIVSPASND